MMNIFSSSCLSALVLTAALAAQSLSPANTQNAPKSVLDGFQVRAASMQDLNLPAQGAPGFEVTVRIAGQDRKLILRAREMRTQGYKLLVHGQNGIQEAPRSANITYRGTVQGEGQSLVAATLFRGQLSALIALSPDQPLWNVQPQTDVDKAANPKTHVIHCSRDSLAPQHNCGVSGHQNPAQTGGKPALGASATKYAEMAIDADNTFYNRNGSNVASTEAKVLTIMNGVDIIYNRDVDIEHLLTAIIVRATKVYSSSTSLNTLLVEMRNRWNANHRDISRDVAHLFTGAGSFSGTVGLAYVGVVCHPTYHYGSNKAFHPSLSTNVGLVAHEAGHNWGSGHCSGSSCYIMCGGLGGCGRDLTKFSSGVQSAITNFANGKTCLNAPSATSTAKGRGCIYKGTAPTFGVQSPRIGQTWEMAVRGGTPKTPGVVLLGFQDTVVLSRTCTAYINLVLTTVPLFWFTTDAGGSWASTPVKIGTPSIFGQKFGLQAALSNLPTAPFGMALTNGSWVKVGY